MSVIPLSAGLRRENPSQDQLWQAAVQAAGEDIATSTGRPRSSWPIIMFMGIVFSGPYLIFKLMSSLSNSVDINQTGVYSTLGKYSSDGHCHNDSHKLKKSKKSVENTRVIEDG